MSRRRRTGLALAGIVLAILGYSLLAPEDTGSGSLFSFRRFLRNMDVAVSDEQAPGDGTFFLPVDRRTDDELDELVAWVDRGGTLVVGDAGSAILGRLGVSHRNIGVFSTTDLRNDCQRAETLGVASLTVASTDRALTARQGAGCFAASGGTYALFLEHGEGEIVVLGGTSFLTDDLLDEADNATFAYDLFGPGPLAIGPPSPPGVSRDLWSTLPAGARIVIWQFVVAGVVFALARGRRLGWPVAEAPPSPIPSSELVHAVGRLYRRAQARDHAADLVRRATAFRLARRFGRPPGDGSDRLSNGLANAAGDDADALERLLDGPPPTTDEAFVASCRELEAVTEKIERVRG